MNSISFHPAYRWPVILAIALHVLIIFFLVASIFFYRPSDYSLEKSSLQATLVSSSQLAAMMTQTKAAPVPKVVPPKPIVQKVIPKEVPKTLPKVTKIPPQTINAKSLQEAMLQEELDAAPSLSKSNKNLKAKQAALMDQQLAEEGQQAQSAQRSQATLAEIDHYKSLILRQIQQNWIMPQNVQNLSCLLQVNVAPGGTVLSVKILKSSGSDVLDRSAIAAVNKSSPLPVPKDGAAFSAFRTFTLTVKPEGSELAES